MKIIFLVFFLFFVTSCTSRIIDTTIISTKSFELSDSENYEKLPDRVEGEDLAHMVIFIPLGLPDIKEAIDNTIEQIPGCIGLVDAVLYHKWFYIPYIYGQFRYVVEGTPIVKKGSPRPAPKKKQEPRNENTTDYSAN